MTSASAASMPLLARPTSSERNSASGLSELSTSAKLRRSAPVVWVGQPDISHEWCTSVAWTADFSAESNST